MTSRVSEYKGHPVIEIESEEENGFQIRLSFGISKAKLILEHLEDIKRFVEDNQ
jgi:hypothetical protein